MISTYRSDDILIDMNIEKNEINVTIPKFSQVLIYHASSGVDVMKKNEKNKLDSGTIKVPIDIDAAILNIKLRGIQE